MISVDIVLVWLWIGPGKVKSENQRLHLLCTSKEWNLTNLLVHFSKHEDDTVLLKLGLKRDDKL